MFDATHAALIMSNAPVELSVAKTHSGLIAGFSLHLVKTGIAPSSSASDTPVHSPKDG
jgi:hypothetical protein